MATKSTTPKKKRTTSSAKKSKSTSTRRSKGGFLFSRKQKFFVSLIVALALVAAGSYLLITNAATTYYRFVGVGSKCLDNDRQKAANGNKIQLWNCNNTPAQDWAVFSDGTVRNRNGYCLDVQGGAITSGSYVVLNKCNSAKSQKWSVNSTTKVITYKNPDIAAGTSLCLDDYYAKTNDGNPIWVYTCNNTAAQKWAAKKVTATPDANNGGSSGGNGAQPAGTGIKRIQDLPGSTFSKQINAAGSGSLVSLEPKTYTFSDFKDGEQAIAPQKSAYGAWLKVKGILGAGSSHTIIQMNANTSGKKGDVPPNCGGGTGCPTNNLYLVRIDGANAKVDGVTIRGTSQGHLYNGLRFDNVANPTFTNSVVESIPGNSSANPGETFAVNLQRTSGTAKIANVTINGKGVGAGGLAANSASSTINIDGLYTTDLRYSAGIALWQQTGTVNVRNFSSINNARALGIERLGATVNLYDPNLGTPKVGHDVTYTPYSGHDSRVNFYFSDASKVPKRKIIILTNTTSVKSKVHVYINGVEQTQSKYVSWQGI